MSAPGVPVDPPPQTVSLETQQAARAFVAALRTDFETTGGNIVAAWTHGILIVACRGPKALHLDELLRATHLAQPGGHPPADTPTSDGASGG